LDQPRLGGDAARFLAHALRSAAADLGTELAAPRTGRQPASNDGLAVTTDDRDRIVRRAA
jgi:hypothetical protein